MLLVVVKMKLDIYLLSNIKIDESLNFLIRFLLLSRTHKKKLKSNCIKHTINIIGKNYS